MTAPVADTGVEQRRLGRLVTDQVPPVDPADFDSWAPEVAELVRRGGRASSTLAAREYAALRVAAGARGRFTPSLAPPEPLDKIAASLRWATFAPGDADVDTRVQGVVQKLVMNPGRFTVADTVTTDPLAVTYARVPAPGACSFCALMAIRGATYASVQTALKTGTTDRSYHSACVLGETLVSSPGTELAHRRLYQGEVVTIRTTVGTEITITPNHPVLTRCGWVPAGLIREGDDVVRRVGSYRELMAGKVPDHQDSPTRIDEVWRALEMDGLTHVPESPEDFHGDGGRGQGYIDVVGPLVELLDSVDPALAELYGELALAGADVVSSKTSAAAAGRRFADGGSGALLPAHRLVRSGSEFLPLVCSHPLMAGIHGIAGIADWQAAVDKPAVDDVAGYLEMLGDGLDGLLGVVHRDEFRTGVRNPFGVTAGNRRRFDPPPLERGPEASAAEAEFGLDLIERLARCAEFEDVVDVRRREATCHVYNLTTSEGWYDANGLIVSNCRCTARPVFTGETYVPPAHVMDAEQVYIDSTGGVTGKAKLSEFRKAWRQRSTSLTR